MRSDFKVSRCSRRCHRLDRPLRPGEWYYSVVREDDEEQLSRFDIAAEAWQGPPAEALGWWKSRMPAAGGGRLKPAPDALLVDLLRQSEPGEPAPLGDGAVGDGAVGDGATAEEPSAAAQVPLRLDPRLRYLLALMLLRRRVLRSADQAAEPGELSLEVVADGEPLRVLPCTIAPNELQRLNDQLTELLFCESE